MSTPYVRIPYTGVALPLSTTDYTLFTTVAAGYGGNWLQEAGIHRIYLTLQNDHTGTLKCSQSQDGGTTWTQVFADISVAASTANVDQPYDFLVEPYKDFRIVWTNGGTNQTTFIVNMAGIDSRNLGA